MRTIHLQHASLMPLPIIRLAASADYDALGAVMYTAIHSGPSPYTPAQRRAWVAQPHSGNAWHKKLAAQFVVMSEAKGEPVGFMSLRPDGYLDLAYITPAARGSGLFRRMYAQIETLAKHHGLARIWVHASLMAQPAFGSMGLGLVRHEVVVRSGEELARAEMEKLL